MQTENEVLTVEEVAKALRICRSLAYREIRAGRIFAVRCGDRYLVPRRALEQLLSGER